MDHPTEPAADLPTDPAADLPTSPPTDLPADLPTGPGAGGATNSPIAQGHLVHPDPVLAPAAVDAAIVPTCGECGAARTEQVAPDTANNYVYVLGQVDYMDVWNHERFASKLQREPFGDEDARALAEFGI